MKQIYSFLLILGFYPIASNAQSLIPGSITEDPNNQPLIAQRFSVSKAKAAAGQEVYVGPSGVTAPSRNKKLNFSFHKTVDFTISYSVNNGNFSNTTAVKNDSGKVVSQTVSIVAINRFLEVAKAARLGNMNFMEMGLTLGDEHTSAAITNLKLNEREITGSYVGTHYGSIFWHIINPDFAHDFTLSGTLIQDGEFSDASDSNRVEFNFGYSKALTAAQLTVFWGDISVQQKGNGHIVNWDTEKEQGNDHFIVEKGSDGINFAGIGLVGGAGTRPAPSTYNFTDQEASEGATYYRIKQIDTEGHYNYSHVVAVAGTASVAKNVQAKSSGSTAAATPSVNSFGQATAYASNK